MYFLPCFLSTMNKSYMCIIALTWCQCLYYITENYIDDDIDLIYDKIIKIIKKKPFKHLINITYRVLNKRKSIFKQKLYQKKIKGIFMCTSDLTQYLTCSESWSWNWLSQWLRDFPSFDDSIHSLSMCCKASTTLTVIIINGGITFISIFSVKA